MSRLLTCSICVLNAATLFAQAENSRPVPLQCAPAAAPTPALTYRLHPDLQTLIPGNAATIYYRAFAFLVGREPDLANAFTDEAVVDDQGNEHFRILEWLDIQLNDLPAEEVRNHLASFSTVLQEAELAARRQSCDWDIDQRQDGLLLLTPELSLFRSLGKILALKSRLLIHDGRYEEAIQTLRINMTLARHLGHGPTESHVLVGIGIAHITLDRVEELLQTSGAPNLYWALASVPVPFCDLQLALADQRDVLTRMLPSLVDLGSLPSNDGATVQLDEVIRGWMLELEVDGSYAVRTSLFREQLYDEARQDLLRDDMWREFVDKIPKSQVVLVVALHHYRKTFDEMTKWTHLPYHQAGPRVDEAYPAFRRSAVRIDSVLTGGVLTELDFGSEFPMVWAASANLDRRLKALQVVEAIRHHAATNDGGLPTTLGDLQMLPPPIDTITGKPFEYRVEGDTATIVGRKTTNKTFSLRYTLTIEP